MVNNSLGGFTPVIDSTGKITGYKTKVGADTVFPFSSAFTIPLLCLAFANNSNEFYGGLYCKITFDVKDYKTLSIDLVRISFTAITNNPYGSAPPVVINSGDTIITTLSNGNTNISLDISNYDTISIETLRSAAAGQNATLTNVVFS